MDDALKGRSTDQSYALGAGDGLIQSSGERGSAPGRTHQVPIDSLVSADSPRLGGEDAEHIRMLAESGAKLPPIIVHRPTMRIIDGMHRLGAARLRGDETIEVTFFDGTIQEAFVLAVQTNTTHGRPLSLADRMKAAERIVRSHPAWSNRTVAAASGLGARTVGEIRRRIDAEGDTAQQSRARIGRDGRIRPLDNTEGRLRASEIIKSHPNASVRQIAKTAGVSPTTALDVRNRLRRGDDPVPSVRIRHASRDGRQAHEASGGRSSAEPEEPEESELAAMLHSLRQDPTLRLSESGRHLLRWILSRAIRPGEWRDVFDQMPNHCTYIIVDVARRCAEEWQRVAKDLEERTQRVA
jgi:ParB-like chromosome segregation protein Spo0J